MEDVFLNWSSGKDAALALHRMGKDRNILTIHLLTTINEFHDRVSMHGLRKSLLIKQLESTTLPFTLISLPEMPSMEIYEERLGQAADQLKADGYTQTAFGDIYLEDLKEYRDKFFESRGISTRYPLWKDKPADLINEFVANGFKAIVVACNEALGESFLGTVVDEQFLDKVPEGIDPCGENGEFHTFCFQGPIFKENLKFEVGERTFKTYPPTQDGKTSGFWFLDLK